MRLSGPPPSSRGAQATGYLYQGGDGVTLDFNPTSATASGKITNWSNAAGATAAFAYNGVGDCRAFASRVVRARAATEPQL